MEVLRNEYLSWVMSQAIAGIGARQVEEGHVAFFGAGHVAHVRLLPLTHERSMVELRIARGKADEPAFLTHFELGDVWRARELFREMARAFETALRRGVERVVVCCGNVSEGAAFVNSMNEVAETLPFALEFCAMSARDALACQDPGIAILLTPDVSCLQGEMYEAHGTMVFSIPPKIYLQQDAFGGLRLLLEAIGEVDALPVPRCLEPVRPFARGGRVLVVNVMYGDRCVRMGYRVYEGQQVAVRGTVAKSRLTMRDMFDLVDSLELNHLHPHDLDAIGFVVPGVVNFCSMNLPSLGERDTCLTDKIQKHYGVPVFIDNNTNAAALGCFLAQGDHQSLTLYRHQLGHKNGGQGTVINGQLVLGRYSLAGEPKFYQRRFNYDMFKESYTEAVWTEKGLSRIAQNVLLATIGTVSPDVACIAVSTITDVEGLRLALEHSLPKYCIPELVAIHDYRERMYLGEAALCLERLAGGATSGSDCHCC